MRPNFDMDALRTLVVGVEMGSFAQAASKLGRSQSAISMQLKKLEQQAGQPLLRRKGRGLSPTEAGDALLNYARKIIALNDEAASSLGTAVVPKTVRIGLPQDFVEDVLPDVLKRFRRRRPTVHVEVRAGRNYDLDDDVRSGRLDLAIAFVRHNSNSDGKLLATLPMLWLGERDAMAGERLEIPLVLFDYPCLFRQTATNSLEAEGLKFRISLTTPSLPGVWAALRFGHGISVRTGHRLPKGISDLGRKMKLPKLPPLELRLFSISDPSPLLAELVEIVETVVDEHIQVG